MSQQPSLTQSAHSVRQVLTAYSLDFLADTFRPKMSLFQFQRQRGGFRLVVIGDELPLYPHQGAIKMHPGVKDELACRGFVCRTLHRLGLNVETIKPNGRPAVGIGWVPPEHADKKKTN